MSSRPAEPRPGTPRSAGRVRSYRLVLPPPWVRVPLRTGTAAAVQALVDRVAATTPAHIPPDQVGPKKRELVRALLERTEALRSQGGLDLYLPADTIHGFLVRTSFSVSEIRPPGADATPVADVRAALLAEPGTEQVVTPGSAEHGLPDSTWVRRQRVLRGEDGADPALLVDYTTAVPGAEQTWLLCSFSCSGTDAADPEGTAVALTSLFDAIMTTWRWEPAVPAA